MNFADLNFVKTCETGIVNTWGDIGDASSTFGILNTTSTQQCYSSAVSYNEIFGTALVFVMGVCVIIWAIGRKNKN